MVSPGNGYLLSILGKGDLGGGNLLASSSKEFVKGEIGVEEYDKNPQQGGGIAAGIWLLFKSMVQVVLFFGEETWVVTPCMGRVLGGSRTKWRGILWGVSPVGNQKGIGSSHWRQ